jgi:late competence protein required for DNA uptake (superfamily II DNA/RNA helicase)
MLIDVIDKAIEEGGYVLVVDPVVAVAKEGLKHIQALGVVIGNQYVQESAPAR